jgi:DNA excision repair protein ERCC-3
MTMLEQHIGRATELLEQTLATFEELQGLIGTEQKGLSHRLAEILSRSRGILGPDVDAEAILQFLVKPYLLLPAGRDQWWLIIPRIVDLQVGWLERQTETYNVFRIDRTLPWLSPLPPDIAEEVGYQPPDFDALFDGVLLKVTKGDRDNVWARYRKFFVRREGEDLIRVKPKSHFQLLAALIDDGVLPFIPRPVQKEHLTDRHSDFKLKPEQEEAWETFLKHGSIGIYWPTGQPGKTHVALQALACLEGRKLIVVPTRTLVEQWQHRIDLWTPCKPDEVEVQTYHSWHKVRGKEWRLVVFDECQHLPADTFSKFATVKTDYRMGLSATPYREDGRANYIIALTGFPIGMDWAAQIKKGKIIVPTVYLHIVRNQSEKVKIIGKAIDDGKKTIVFCDGIDRGHWFSIELGGVPHVHGDTKARMEILEEAQVAVVSRVGDAGISLPKLDRIFEVDFLGGSRAQEIQRMGRLMHRDTAGRGEHHILMTGEEFETNKKRLLGLYEKGIEVEVVE